MDVSQNKTIPGVIKTKSLPSSSGLTSHGHYQSPSGDYHVIAPEKTPPVIAVEDIDIVPFEDDVPKVEPNEPIKILDKSESSLPSSSLLSSIVLSTT